MKKSLKKIMIIVIAAICAFSVHISVSAASVQEGIGDFLNPEKLSEWLAEIFGGNTTAPNEPVTPEKPDNTTEETTTQSKPTAANPFWPNVTGSNVVTTDSNTYYFYPTTAQNIDVNIFTTAQQTTEPEEESSYFIGSSLSGLFEEDTAAVLVQTPTEPFTLGAGLVVNNGDKDDFTWQKAALIAAAVLFVVLAALVVALLVQRGKQSKNEKEKGSAESGSPSDSSNSGPVPVEVMTPERIAELLGSASSISSVSGSMTSEESAAAIKTAALMGQLTHTYSDPLIRKYTDEPVMISPTANMLDMDNLSGEQLLKATDSMLDDITGNEKYAADTSGISVKVDDIDIEEYLSDSSKTKYCPECNKPVASGDIFCHSCGAYVG